jgi:hypothetical protein
MTSRRLPPPMNIMEGSDTTAPSSGVQDLIDKQKKELFSDKAAERFNTEKVPSRVYTHKTNRKLPPQPTISLEQKENETKTNALHDTFETCVNACTGAAYDAWHFKNLPGNIPTRLHTIATRGGRGPYLMLTMVIAIAVLFCVYYCLKGKSAHAPYAQMRAPFPNNTMDIKPGNTIPSPPPLKRVVATPEMAPIQSYTFA